ncbi:MAG TPA: DUF1501 domain-containing protein [Planctomycetota bacterium]|nr:DUF1501 domain-containing protein [Planctomycetota bacterium]
MNPIDRRCFLRAASAVPFVLGARGHGAWLPKGDARALLVLELVGGNDGLNTVIPADDAAYGKRRPTLSAVRSGARPLGDGTSLHAALVRLHGLVQGGDAAVVHGVGYPGPDRSHFRSREIWHTADPAHTRVRAQTTGWLGRTADELAATIAGVPAAAIGGLEVPLLLKSARVTVPSIARIEDFQWLSATADGALPASSPTRAVPGCAAGGAARDDLRAFVADTARSAVELAGDLDTALQRYRPQAEYPASELGRDLQLGSRLLVAGFGTRLLHVAVPGFDTHARQLPTHAGLLAQLDAAFDAFVQDLRAHGRARDVAVLVHSEFGRRTAENASQGTDHGAAAPAFVCLGGVAGGPHGEVPDLQHLDDGDLVATADFRRVFGDLLRWLGVEPARVLGAPFATLGLFPAVERR